MGRFGRTMQDIADGFRVSCDKSIMAVEWLIGVVLLVATVAGSAAAAMVWAPDLDIRSGFDARAKQRTARSELSSERRVRNKTFRICGFLTALWSAVWTFVFSYGPPAGGMAAMLQVIVIPPAVMVLLVGLRCRRLEKLRSLHNSWLHPRRVDTLAFFRLCGAAARIPAVDQGGCGGSSLLPS
jgi:hypothetical protein